MLEADDRVELLEGITSWLAVHPVVRRRRYAVVRVAGRGETITLAAFPDVTLAVDDLLPPCEGSVG